MTKLPKVLSVFFIGCCFVLATNQAHAAFRTVNDLVPWMYEYEKADQYQDGADYCSARVFRAYVQGVFDATEAEYDAPRGLSSKQMIAAVIRYIKNNPKEWSRPAESIIKEALKDAFPRRR